MRVLGIDPSMTMTGFALVSIEGDQTRLEFAGTIKPKGETVIQRVEDLCAQLYLAIKKARGEGAIDLCAIETPQTTSFGRSRQRNTNTLPLYGMAVGAAIATAERITNARTIGVSASEWGMRIRTGGAGKPGRIAYAGLVIGDWATVTGGMNKEQLEAVADAALLADWAGRRELAKALVGGGKKGGR